MMEQPSRGAEIASRVMGPLTYIVLLARVQLIVTVVLVATLSDWAVSGSMREALRYSIVDAPWQFVTMAIGLLLACLTIRVTSESTIELVAPDMYEARGNVGLLAHLLPRACAALVAIALACPLLQLAVGPGALASAQHRTTAALAALAFLVIGFGTACLPKVRAKSWDETRGVSAPLLLRLALVLIPLAFAGVIISAVMGFSRDGTGIAFDAVTRYRDSPSWQVAAEAVALLLVCSGTRLAVAIVIELISGDREDGGRFARALRNWLPRGAAIAVGLALALQLLDLNFAPSGAFTAGSPRWVWGIAAAYIAIGLAAALLDISWSPVPRGMNPYGQTARRWRAAAERLTGLAGGWGLLLALMVFGAIAVSVFFVDVSRVHTAQAIGPIGIILLWGFAASALFFPIAYLAHLTRMPLLLLLLVAGVTFAGFDLNDNHGLRGVAPADIAVAAPDGTFQSSYRENLDLGAWIASRTDWDRYDNYPVFLVATEGGGIRAAYFTAAVLSALQERCPQFAQHTLAISGVSGGSVGAAVFAALTADRARNVADAACALDGKQPGSLVGRARDALSSDLLSPLLCSTLFADALQRVLPFAIDSFDRARALEYALQDAWQDANGDCPVCARRMSDTVGHLYRYPVAATRPPVPHLFLNTTEVKSGRNVPFATAHVPTLATPFLTDAELDQPGLAALRLLTLQDHITDSGDDVPLSSAALLSARFPYLTPAGRLAGIGHYVDGGYFENSGTSLVSGLVQNLIGQKIAYRNPQNPALEAAVRNAVFITIVIHSEPCTTVTCSAEGEVASTEDDSWNEVLSPVRALLNTREQRAEYSINDLDALTALVEQLSPTAALSGADDASCDAVLCAVTLRFASAPGTEVPLTWVLSEPARGAMDEAVTQMEEASVRNRAPASAFISPDSNAPAQNSVLGSYRRILCLLAARKDASDGCAINRSEQ